MSKQTPMYDAHKNLGARFVEYAGWEMPVSYEGLEAEHKAVREEAGLFDVSHMGEVYVKGTDAAKFLNETLSNEFTKLDDGQTAYTFVLNKDGGIVDDLLVYKFNDEFYMLVPNAANTKKVIDYLTPLTEDYDIIFEDKTPDFGQIAIQGPKSEEILQPLVDTDLSKIKYFRFEDEVPYKNYNLIISRTGYTGEDGFEIYGTPEAMVEMWDELLETGKDKGLVPAGLGSRDTLRFEAGLPLYGNEMGEDINPLEVGLGFAVKLNKDHFIGQEATQKLKDEGIPRKLVGIEMIDRRPARNGAEVEVDGKEIGYITTGYMAPTVGKMIANALVEKDSVEIGDEVDVMIRGRAAKAKVIERNFLEK